MIFPRDLESLLETLNFIKVGHLPDIESLFSISSVL
jgi:hypothetical protein